MDCGSLARDDAAGFDQLRRPNAVRRDALGRVLKQVEIIEGVQHTTAFSYYESGWLRTVQRDGVQTAEYTYDANGRSTDSSRGLSSRRVPQKPRATPRDRELQSDAGRPHASHGTH